MSDDPQLRDTVVGYLAQVDDAELAQLIADSGERRHAATDDFTDVIDSLREIQDALDQLNEKITAAEASGDTGQSILLKQQGKPLWEAQKTKKQELNSRLSARLNQGRS